jgi:hypothetical protein
LWMPTAEKPQEEEEEEEEVSKLEGFWHAAG